TGSGPDGPPLAFLPAGQGVDEVGQAVQVGDDVAGGGVEPAVVDGGHRGPLRPPDHAAGQVEGGGHPVLPGQDELPGRVVAGGDVVDDRLEGGDHLGRDQRHARLQLRPVLGGGGQFGADHEQFPLEADQQFAQFGAGLGLGPGQAEGGHRLVDLAVGRGAGGVLPDPAAVEQAGRAVVALPCVDLHEDGESTTPSEFSWMLRYPEPTMGRFLDTLRERIVVFDGATGTNLQQRDLGADDFGGPALEGCNEILAVTRPAVIADLHRSFFEVGVDAVETDTFGAFPVVLAEYGI